MKKPKLQELTLREKIGQTCIMRLDFPKGDPNFFKENPYGGLWTAHIFLTESNTEFVLGNDIGLNNTDLSYPKKLDRWIKDCNKNLKVPLFGALDAESGAASGIPGLSSTIEPSAIGSANDENLAFNIGKNVADEVLSAGCNWIWGPVADNACMFSGVMTLRTYSNDVELCSRMLKSQLSGIQSAGVAATAKHFPGADRHEYRDPHTQPSEISYSMKEWEEYQGNIFQAAIDAGVYSIMVGHSSFPAADDTKVNGNYLPATLSYKIITELLKEKMGFDGVVVTDGVNMRGLTMFYTGKELYTQLLLAGNDVILGPEIDYLDAVEEAVLEGSLPESRIDDACQRVLDMKEKLGLFDDDYTCGGGITEELISATRNTSREIARKGLSLLSNNGNLLPLDPQKIKTVTIIYDGYSEGAYNNLKYMAEEFEKHGAKAVYRKSITSAEDMRTIAESSDLIVYASFIGCHTPPGLPAFYGDKVTPFQWVLTEGQEKSVGVSLGYPFMYYNYYTTCPVFVNTYSSSRASVEEFVKGLYGDFELSTFKPFPIKPEM